MSRTSQRSTLTTPTEEHSDASNAPPLPSSMHSRVQSGQSQDDIESTIQVVIRCRRRSDREVQENSPIIISSTGARSQAITIETATPVSSLGMVTFPPTRTYPFDAVFGPEADQAMIYQEVVSPMLNEVLQGYNCTLFAYGQTGTGKTYTMQGDLGTTPMGNPNAQAGMIPRVLFKLFHQLESAGSDYSVKISYVELYNEELRDLLTPELAAPVGTTQPMGMGAGGPRDPNSNQGGLKIFEDASKKGVFIQGLEEMAVKDAADALALLVKGSDRRQIAATKFNDHSSRSHSVFSITVHTKETSSMGEDLLRVGKMNLVDLAGSENIGRSGAENKRAREAGMINQSLLTLGRVINALVERSSHIPYRESKLTRLLQDSLGGRTKTCIIATISPARSNMEETLSTLDYAIRAKSIRNRPEVNQRMTRNSLLKEYIAEIERLKSDVLAAREKNGIFFSEDTWNQMSSEREIAKTEMEEAKRQVEIVESQLKSVREEFEESMKLLLKRDGELKETTEKLLKTESFLQAKQTELTVTKVALEEETEVRRAYQRSEAVLDEVAQGLKKTVEESVSDANALFAKLARKSAVLDSNTKAVFSCSKTVTAETQNFSTQLDKFIKSSVQSAAQLRSEAEQHQTKELETLANHSDRISEQILRVQEVLQTIQAKDDVSSEAVSVIQSAVKEAHESIKTGFFSWSERFRVSNASICAQVEKASLDGCHVVDKALKSMGALVETVIREALEHIEVERKSMLEAKALADTATNNEIHRLQEQNDDLIKRISGLLGDFVTERDRSLREAFMDVTDSNEKGERAMASFVDQHVSKVEGVVVRGHEWSVGLEKKGGENKRLRDGALKSLGGVNHIVKDGLANVRNSSTASLSSYSTDIQQQTHALNVTTADAFERHARAKRARIEATNVLSADIQSGSRQSQRIIASTSRNLEAHASRVVTESSKLSESFDAYGNATTERLSTMRQVAHTLIEQGARDDLPTGKTPRKRVRQYVDRWELTKSRDVILKDWRQRIDCTSESETSLAESIPLPSSHGVENMDSTEHGVPPMEVERDDFLVTSQSSTLTTLASSTSSSASSIPAPSSDSHPLKNKITSTNCHSPLIRLGCWVLDDYSVVYKALTFVTAPLPNALFSHCGGDDFGEERSGPMDLGRFITAMIVVTGFAFPLVLAHSEVIRPGACVMSIVGGGLVYGTILAYSAFFKQDDDSEYD
ncbi:hypothetical protein EW146_g4276 [Bondarzewia mesenterica]|uniref:Kinesin motor domain-containing protein n=1 Tax=Bondarzewia mesenterica TaxID=1095465 RepID=A0A4S4M0V0_9AGAM|nr:hypothetical protein EW146_g4276 [Bondarzewia mesenterica]